MSARIIKRRFLGENNILKTKHDFIITSTPIKKKTAQELDIESCISPVLKNSNESPEPIIDLKNIEDKKSKIQTARETESIEKICLLNNFPESNNAREISNSDDNNDVGNKIKQTKQLIVMDSDEEEEFWQNRGEKKPGKKRKSPGQQLFVKKKIREEIAVPKSVITDEERTSNEENDEIISPKGDRNSSKTIEPSVKKDQKDLESTVRLPARKNTAERLKSNLKMLKNLLKEDEARDNSDASIFDKRLEREVRNRESKNDENSLRRSNRVRSKPLEFWNGERMDISTIDLSTGIKRPKKNYVRRKNEKEVRDVEDIEPEREELEQIDQISNRTENSKSKKKPEEETSLRKKTGRKKEGQSILKTRTSTRSKTNVRFSSIGAGTTIDGPTIKRNIKPDWVINFPKLHSAEEKLLPDSENCIVLPGLNTAGKIISSAVMQMRSAFIYQNRAPDLRHLIFCVMTGTVSVTIDETTVRMETYGHFSVPCGVSYSIENIGKQEAFLSYFQVACSCV